MQSLKELRAENAARQLSRTADDVAASELSTPSGGRGATASAAPSSGAPRLGRTLAPLAVASTSSLAASLVGSAGGAEGTVTGGQEEDREARRRRRRQKREKQQQQQQQQPDDEGDERLSAHGDEVHAGALSGASSRASTVEGEQNYAAASGTAEEEATVKRGTAIDGGLDGTGGVDFGTRQDELPVQATSHAMEGSGAGGGGSGEKPLSARGAPPQEKPKKKLTPLAARRARIEQQKREEAERKSGVSQGAPPEDPSTFPPGDRGGQTPGGKGAPLEREVDSKSPSKGDTGKIRGGMFGNRSAARRRNEQSKQQELSLPNKSTGEDAEHDPLIADDANVGATVAESKNTEYDFDNALATGNGAESNARGGAAGGGEGRTEVEGGNTDESEREGGATDDRTGEDPAEGGRFKGMRGRMKTARKGLMNTKSPSLATFRRGNKGEGGKIVGRGDSSRSREREEVPAADDGREGSGEIVSEDGEGRIRVPGEVSDGVAKNATTGATSSGVLEEQDKDSDTASNNSGLPPAANEADNDSTDDTGDSDDSDHSQGDKARKKGWRSGRAATEATTVGGDKQVTLGHVVDRKMREMGYIRKPAVDELKNRRSLRDRVAAEGAPEVHFIGEITGAEGFGSGVSCRFRVEGGRHWTCLAGLEEGQTHVIHADYGESFAPWNHPIDLHYTTKSIQGWPRLMVQVWQLDAHGRNILRGYGFRHLPSTPGFSEVSLPCWRPTGTMQEETAAFFLGVTPRLTAEDAVFNRAWDQRCRLVTLPAGTVWIQMNGLFRNLQDQDMNTFPFS